MTFGPVAGSDWAARAGVNASRRVAFFGELGRMTDVLPKSDQQTISNNAVVIADLQGGSPATFGRMPAAYGLVGARVNGHDRHRVTPFVDAAIGFAHMTNGLTATVDGADVSSLVLTTPLTSKLPQTAPLMALGGGLSVRASTRTAVDLGYRYSRISATDQGINISNLYGGMRIGF